MEVSFRRATHDDVARIVALLADDDIGRHREHVGDPLDEGYLLAFAAIDADERQLLVVGEDDRGRVVATAQLSFIPSLTFVGAERTQLEAVRVERALRGRGIGRQLIAWSIDRARDRGCRVVQLTTSHARRDAQRFYEGLGFSATHVGMKLTLA